MRDSHAFETLLQAPNDWMPNNRTLPVLLYRQVVAPDHDDAATAFEELFASNGWRPSWRNGIYGFHHFHSTAHEVLGFAKGRVRLILGGEGGREITVQAGDVALLPVGTGHCKIEGSEDLLVVGAYPPDQSADLHRNAASAEALARMENLPFPRSDPVFGRDGPLLAHWKQTP